MPAPINAYGWRVPVLGTDAPDGPADLTRLAGDIYTSLISTDAKLNALGGALGDSGWVTLTLTAGFTAITSGGYPTPSVRRIGKIVHSRGLVTLAAGAYTGVITTLAAAYCPQANEILPPLAMKNKAFQISVTSSGSMSVMPQPTYSVGTAAASDLYSLYGSWMVV